MAGREVACVVNRCHQALENNKLDLSCCQLTSVPDAIFLLLSSIELKCCTFSQNLLRKIPSKLAVKFNLLIELDLSHNHLSCLPEELKHMDSLSTLDISHNDFSTLPSIIYKLDSLKKMNAEKNNIQEIDVTKLKLLPNLVEINMQENPLTQDTYTHLLNLTDKITVLVTPLDAQGSEVNMTKELWPPSEKVDD
ncbi:leucine-rich repeat-containing protein 40-like isoform X1 [Biomphalaria glabrata]|uniref:Leucine-rich repeat-containing protein 40-like isoform X1 n=1 Tax=Biomphalaria glabrata TaxID=6526 RepID=A0A9W2ZSL3_BIOGL|nr:leucine-rich repeat-containing protein 40-like isoform X1 [Biomphalaria glabrata]XP_055878036.1 leucine-rich repeat-containing protein 40-like isoform X1 [Biomphalaria glabrata]XP_055878037.1 leucine-rich repeat-containing protein 40-like isoform X1 [Biomphalaria glabrata]